MAAKPPRHIVFCVNHPSPHMADLFRALEARDDVDLDGLFMAAEDPDRVWGADADGFRHRFLPVSRPGTVKINRAIRGALAGLRRPETVAILTLYTWLTTWLAARWLHRQGVPWLMMAEPPSRMAGPLWAAVRAGLFRTVTRRAAGILAIGRRAVEEFEETGISRARLLHVQYVLDVSTFAALPRDAGTAGVRFLSVGQLIPRKGFDLLLRAFAAVDDPAATLRITGEGELRAGLERLARDLGLADRVRIEPPVPYARRHEAFARADVFVLATRNDGWGMVVPEAMAAGLPVVTTPECGAGLDLVAPGTGLIAEPAGLAAALRHYVQNPAAAREDGQRAREHLARVWTPRIGAEFVLEGVTAALASDSDRPLKK